MFRWLVFILWFFYALASSAQSVIQGVSVNTQYGFIFAHSKAVQNTSGANPFAIQLEYDRQLLDSQTWDLCHCYPHQGFMLNYTNYDVGLLGSGINGGYYLEPSFFLTKNLEFGVRGTAGLSWSSNPYDPSSNPGNQSYSTAINAYLALGFNLSAYLSRSWQLNGFAQYNHISNGGLKNPNKGINWPTAGLGFRYRFLPMPVPDFKNRRVKVKKAATRADVAAFYTNRTIAPGKYKRYSISGLTLSIAHNQGRLHGWLASAEFTYDGALRERMRTNGYTNTRSFLSGVAVGHEFLLGKFIFGQQVGLYLGGYGPFYNLLYHRWGLGYRLNPNLGLGISLKAHGQVANFADIRIVYSINW